MPKRMVNKINFFCIGTQKSGTTLLHDILKQHTDIYLPEEKEAHFFDVNELYNKGLDYYFNTYYKSYSKQKIVGNINPNLQVEYRSIDRIVESFGENIKIVILLRNPVDRAYSHYLMSKKRGYEDLSFDNAIKQENERLSNPKVYKDYESQELGHFEKNHLGYIRRSLYAELIQYAYSKFGRNNVKVYIFEEFVGNKESVIKDIFKFLSVEEEKLNLDIKSNPAQKAVSFKLSKFLNTSSILKDCLKIVSPRFLRQPIKEFVNTKNMKTLSTQDKVKPYDYMALKNQYFAEDIKNVECLLGRKIDKWA